jgi:hypothetical protein
LDDDEFFECTCVRCQVLYCGGRQAYLVGCRFEDGCSFHPDDAAHRTLEPFNLLEQPGGAVTLDLVDAAGGGRQSCHSWSAADLADGARRMMQLVRPRPGADTRSRAMEEPPATGPRACRSSGLLADWLEHEDGRAAEHVHGDHDLPQQLNRVVFDVDVDRADVNQVLQDDVDIVVVWPMTSVFAHIPA